MTDQECTCKSTGCKTHCKSHIKHKLGDMAQQIADGLNVCAKVGTGGHWNRRVASCDIEDGVVVLREGGKLARPIWRAPMGSIKHTEFPGGIQRFRAPGVKPLFLHAN